MPHHGLSVARANLIADDGISDLILPDPKIAMPKRWFYPRGMQAISGPCSLEELMLLAASGLLSQADRVWGSRMFLPVKAGALEDLPYSLSPGGREATAPTFLHRSWK
jgi:hypothetical protein